jgi:alpha-mannosidase
MYGREYLPEDGTEAASQRWTAITSEKENRAVTIINNCTYGSDFTDGEARISLLRSPAYSAGCSDFSKRRAHVLPQDRCTVFMDQGEHVLEFVLGFGAPDERMANIEAEAAAAGEKPYALSCFPAGERAEVLPLVELDDPTLQLTAFKKSEDGTGYVIRLFEPVGRGRRATLRLPVRGVSHEFEIGPFEILTLKYNPSANCLLRSDLLEKTLE